MPDLSKLSTSMKVLASVLGMAALALLIPGKVGLALLAAVLAVVILYLPNIKKIVNTSFD